MGLLKEASPKEVDSTDPQRIRHLFLLAGQSNMEGMGWVHDLPSRMLKRRQEVPIYHPNRRKDHEPPDRLGSWQPLAPGHGAGYHQSRRLMLPDVFGRDKPHLSDRFGLELTFADHLHHLAPDLKIALFKYAKGGSALHTALPTDWGTWDTDPQTRKPANQWTHFKLHYQRALTRWSNGPRRDEILRPSGILWLQGESDASYTREMADAYLVNLRRLIQSIRSLADDPALPALIGRISHPGGDQPPPHMPWAEKVQQAQEAFVSEDPKAALIRLDREPGWQDEWHYDSRTYLELGVAFAEAAVALFRQVK